MKSLGSVALSPFALFYKGPVFGKVSETSFSLLDIPLNYPAV
jgi:hypothetical protein